MASWGFWNNAALSGSAMTELPATTYPTTTQRFWFGSTTSGFKLQAATDPGTDPLELSIADSATGGHAITAVKLATTSGGLATATAGATLDLSTTQILGGASNAVEIWAQVTDAIGAVAKSTELSLVLTPWVQSAT